MVYIESANSLIVGGHNSWITMAGRRRPGFESKLGFRQAAPEGGGVHAALLKSARGSGQLNLSNRHLTQVPDAVWRINLDVPEEAKSVSLDNTEDRWWEQVDLTKLILASNVLSQLSEDISNLPALTVLDVHDNQLTNLPQAVGGLSTLQRLNLSHNRFQALPECVGQLRSLVSLQVHHNQITELGPHVGNLYNLDELDVSHNQLTELPRTIGHLSKLFRLNIANNKLAVIPEEIGDMNALRTVELTHNQLTSLPEEVGRLTHLEQLYLRHNRLTSLPVLKNCTALKELHVGNNALREITSEHLQHLTQVSVLDVRDNKISVLPDEITLLEGLQRLDLTNNDLSGLPYALGNLVNLKSIVLDGNPMKSIRRDIIMRGTNELKKYLCSRLAEESDGKGTAPPGVRSNVGTSGIIGGATDSVDAHEVGVSKTLDYSEKRVCNVPDDVWQVAVNKAVAIVNLSKNNIAVWPEWLSRLSETLKQLNLGVNKLTSVPPQVGQLQQLVFLDLRSNQLSELPQELGMLECLRELILSYNRFKILPSAVYGCAKLEIILASGNQISEVDPEKLRRLPLLATLDLQNNNMTQVPPTLGLVRQLRSLQLEGNPFRVPRPGILTKGTLSVLEYLRDRIPQ